MRMIKKTLTVSAITMLTAFSGVVEASDCPDGYSCTHALSMWDKPLYDADAKQLSWANVDAPKGGLVKVAAQGTFDTLNPYILKGVSASGISSIYDTLLGHSNDEAFTVYPLIAKQIQLADDYSNVIYVIDERAQFHDGHPITAEDVKFSYEVLTTKGLPYYRSYWADVQEVNELDDGRRIQFVFKHTKNRELPLILGQMPILPKHYYDQENVHFDKTTLTPPLGSGAYKIGDLDPGKWIRYDVVEDYWAKDLLVQEGLNNFNIQYDYYRDGTVMIEAFKAGEFDFRQENISKSWASAYNIPEVEKGDIVKREAKNNNPNGMQGFFYNIRRDKFSDARVREAIGMAFDFEWTNKHIFYDAYERTESYFSNSEFASSGLPSEAELALLEPFKDSLPEAVFTQEYEVPKSNGSGNIRKRLKVAKDLLAEAGWTIQGGELKNASGEPFEIEFLLVSPTYERIVSPMIKHLKRLGIVTKLRTIDAAQYVKRVEQFDFDVIIHSVAQSMSPGNEQMEYWHSTRADMPGSRNIIGIKNKAVDALVEKITRAQNKEELVAATHALDRVLLNEHYVIPHFHSGVYRLIYWNRFGIPEKAPNYAVGFESWWIDAEKSDKLKARLGR